jgi:hypothetical protein
MYAYIIYLVNKKSVVLLINTCNTNRIETIACDSRAKAADSLDPKS